MSNRLPKRSDVHTPQPILPTVVYPAVVREVNADIAHHPAVQSVLLPNGQVVTGYAMQQPASAEPERARVSPVAVNIALGGVGFAAACGGLLLLTSFIAALAALVAQLIVLAAVIFGGFIAVQVLGSSKGGGNTTINKTVHNHNRWWGRSNTRV
jgi:hypothetical protein